MKTVHGLIRFVLAIMILALGLFLVADVFGVQNPIWDYLVNDQAGRFLLGASLIVGVLLQGVTGLMAVRTEHYLSFNTEGGTVSISTSAINDFLARVGREFLGVVDIQADISSSHNEKIEVRLEVNVRDGANIQQLCQSLQQRARESMRDSLGITNVSTIKVTVNEIAPAPKTTDSRMAPPPAGWKN